MLFNWKPEYATTITEIDVQHMELVRLGRQIEKLLFSGAEDIYDELVELIDSLKAYTIYHFASEESLLERYAYPALDAHQVEHQKFIDELNEIDLSELDINQKAYAMDLIKFISKWIFSHILGADSDYKLFFMNENLIEKANSNQTT
ncbi:MULTISPECIES: bacteriohemerythrin [unclassified Fusibacter]|uniref:bacteriohemerythrin n=1 Tax=unclassified Fusibacter TaxID=2624464 RepID=UPI001011056B|nr:MULTISPECIES: bacteriohemerythrin [unclassified Fusibacter]MCK8060538.1 bacteriohemerythrin [Fusibacter sp. A2]NPE23008.1 hemerythrin family protein [Fusibacter sp. A1]RXV60073.1 bacteriohemerythrin [Fusibacter sp. A1]